MTNTSKTNSLSSMATVLTIAGGLLAVLLLPNYFDFYPASLKTLTFFATALLIFAYFLVTVFRRKKLYFNLSPLSLSLVLLAGFVCLSLLVQSPFHAAKSFLSLGGIIIAACTLAFFSTTLIKIIDNRIATNTILGISIFSTFAAVIALIQSFGSVFPPSFVSAIYEPGLNLSLTLIGIAICTAGFFKKNKFKGPQLFALPVFIIGLILTLYLDFQATPITPSFGASLTTAARQLTENSRLNYKTLLFGSQAQDYADVYDHFGQDGDITHLGQFHQAYSAPLTIFTMYGGLALIVWLVLVAQTIWLCFDQNNPYRDLYFILLTTFCVQLFTPIYPLILIIQAIIIAFATNKNKQLLINFNSTTISTDRSEQDAEKHDYVRIISLTASSIMACVLAFVAFCLSQNYQGFLHYKLSIEAYDHQDSQGTLSHAQTALAMAGRIDFINLYNAGLQTELMLDSVDDNQDAAIAHFNQALALAEKAIALEPLHANNYYAYAEILRQGYAYFVDEKDIEAQAAKIISAYTTASLYQSTNPDILLSLGGFYQSVGRFDDALKFYQTALKINPNYAQSNYQLAAFYQEQGNLDQARSAYTNTLQLLEADSDDYAQVQMILDSLGE